MTYTIYPQVKELGNPKNKKGKDSPPHVDICETVRPIIENGDELPLGLLCRLIKFKILWLKQADQQRIAAEKKVIVKDRQVNLPHFLCANLTCDARAHSSQTHFYTVTMWWIIPVTI